MNMAQTRLGTMNALSRGRRGIDRYGWRALTKEVVVRSTRPALAPVAARQLQSRIERADGIDEVLDLAWDFNSFGISVKPCQSRWEFSRLLKEVMELSPRAMLEVGTATGGSLMAFARICAPDAQLISVDLPDGMFGGGYPAWKIPVYKAFATRHQRLDLIRGDSHSPGTFAEVEARLDGRKLDFLFIDGDHTYEGVRHDFESYRKLVRPGGLIALHDIAPRQANSWWGNNPGEVPQFWADLTKRGGTREFIEPDGAGCFGIGLLSA